ncbi:MAG: hypothetical protein HUK20_06410 [Fibrobacter sp.]|nr:hypothetical protein [Fibrobacter sp.]
MIHVEGNMIYVNVPEKSNYILETVTTVGTPLLQIVNGTLGEGEHSISIETRNSKQEA